MIPIKNVLLAPRGAVPIRAYLHPHLKVFVTDQPTKDWPDLGDNVLEIWDEFCVWWNDNLQGRMITNESNWQLQSTGKDELRTRSSCKTSTERIPTGLTLFSQYLAQRNTHQKNFFSSVTWLDFCRKKILLKMAKSGFKCHLQELRQEIALAALEVGNNKK